MNPSFQLTNTDDLKRLRRIGFYEGLYLNECACCLMTRLFKIISRIDLFKDLDLNRKAIFEWMTIHPFLRCQIVKLANVNESETTSFTKYFYLKDLEDFKQLSNVDFILVKTNNDTIKNEAMTNLLIERELSTKIEIDFNSVDKEQPLWRLLFIKFNTNENDNEYYNFNVLFTIHHTIMEGRSTYRIILQLLSIMEDMYENKYKAIPPTLLLPTVEEVFYANNKHITRTDEGSLKYECLDFINAPELVDNSHVLPYKELCEKIEIISLTSNANNNLLTSKHLIELSKSNNSKFQFVLFDSKTNLSLIKRCKHYQVKFYSFLNTVLNLSFRKLYTIGHDVKIDSKHEIFYVNSISLRFCLDECYLNGSDCNEILGYFVNYFLYKFTSLDDTIKEDDDDATFIKKFWKLAELETDKCQQRLNKNEHLVEPNWAKNLDPNEANCDYWLANLGIMPNKQTPQSSIEIKESFFAQRFTKEFKDRVLFNNFATIDNQLYWSIAYNSNFINQHFIDDYILFVSELINKLAN